MIDTQIIESAKTIRKEYLKITDDISKYDVDLKKLVEFLKEKMKVLENLKDQPIQKGREQEQFDNMFKKVLEELNSIEEEEKKLSKKIRKMNTSLDKLKRDEQSLYTVVKERYPKLTDEQIKKEIHKHLDK